MLSYFAAMAKATQELNPKSDVPFSLDEMTATTRVESLPKPQGLYYISWRVRLYCSALVRCGSMYSFVRPLVSLTMYIVAVHKLVLQHARGDCLTEFSTPRRPTALAEVLSLAQRSYMVLQIVIRKRRGAGSISREMRAVWTSSRGMPRAPRGIHSGMLGDCNLSHLNPILYGEISQYGEARLWCNSVCTNGRLGKFLASLHSGLGFRSMTC